MKKLLKKALCLCVAAIMLAAMFPMGALAAEPPKDMSPLAPPDWIEIPPVTPATPSWVDKDYIWFICQDYYGNSLANLEFTAQEHIDGSRYDLKFGTEATFTSDYQGYLFIPYAQRITLKLLDTWQSIVPAGTVFGISPCGGYQNPIRIDDGAMTGDPVDTWTITISRGKIVVGWGPDASQLFEYYGGFDLFVVGEDEEKGKIKDEPKLELEKTVVAVNGDNVSDSTTPPAVKEGDEVTYEFVITNTGGHKGDLGQIIDTIPANFAFSNSNGKNTEWTQDTSGKLIYTYNDYVYPAARENDTGDPIDPVPVKIYLTLTLTDETTGVDANGLIKNTAVITNVKGEPWDDDDADIKPLPPAAGSLTIAGKKTVTGAGLADKMFSFTLKDKDGNTYSSKNDASGNFTFTKIDYDKPGTHEYTVTEDTPPSGWTNNTGEIKIWVKVVLDETTNCYVATAYSKDTYADADKIVDLPGFLTFQNTYNSGGGEIPSGGTTPGGEDKDDGGGDDDNGGGDDGNNDNGNNDNDDDDDDTDDKPVPTPPVVNTPTVQPQPSNPENTIVAIDEDRYIEYNPDGVPLGEWHLNEDNEWIFDDYMPLGSFPSTSDSSVEKAALLLAGLSLLGIVITAKSRKAKRVK